MEEKKEIGKGTSVVIRKGDVSGCYYRKGVVMISPARLHHA